MSSTARYDAFVQRLTQSVLDTLGMRGPRWRRAVLERGSARLSGRDALAPELASYIDKVARHAYQGPPTQSSRRSDTSFADMLFEMTVAATVGAALHRLERGMAALCGEEPD